MVLHDVADRADGIVELRAAFDAEALRHRDLDVRDAVLRERGLEERIRRAEVDDVLHRLFAEEVIDAEERVLGEHLVERGGELLRRREVVAERLLEREPCAFREADRGKRPRGSIPARSAGARRS